MFDVTRSERRVSGRVRGVSGGCQAGRRWWSHDKFSDCSFRAAEGLRGQGRARRHRSRCSCGHGLLPARPERGGQDDDGQRADHVDEGRRWDGTRRRARCRDRDQGGARGHRGHRSVRRGGRAADGPGEPAADGGSQAAGLRRGQADRHRAAGAVRPGGVGAEAGVDLFRGYAPEAGSGDDAGRQPADHLPGRADDGTGPAQPPHDVGRSSANWWPTA